MAGVGGSVHRVHNSVVAIVRQGRGHGVGGGDVVGVDGADGRGHGVDGLDGGHGLDYGVAGGVGGGQAGVGGVEAGVGQAGVDHLGIGLSLGLTLAIAVHIWVASGVGGGEVGGVGGGEAGGIGGGEASVGGVGAEGVDTSSVGGAGVNDRDVVDGGDGVGNATASMVGPHQGGVGLGGGQGGGGQGQGDEVVHGEGRWLQTIQEDCAEEEENPAFIASFPSWPGKEEAQRKSGKG